MKLKKIFCAKRESSFLRKGLMLLVCFLVASTASIYAQTREITGKVTDKTGEPLPGLTVLIKGTSTGTVTDLEGVYTLQASNTNELVFSFIGMLTQNVVVGNQSVINIVMQDDVKSTMLTETVIIGYGAAKGKDLTSPISTIKSDEIAKHLTASPMQGLNGKLPGIQIVNSGRPGDSPKVRIRGVGGFDSNDPKKPDYRTPLYVVDGMFFDNIDFLNSGDIENFSVLKDASSAAIYGVRAANGVIIITTKRGLPNQKAQVTYDGYFGIQSAKNVVKMASADDYEKAVAYNSSHAAVVKSARSRFGSVNTDWFDKVLRTAPMHSHALSIVGGAEKMSYMVSGNYLNQQGIAAIDNSFERANIRAKIDANVYKWLKVGANLGISNSTKQEVDLGLFGNAYNAPAIYPVYDPNNTEAINKGNIDYASPQSIGLTNYFKNPMAIGYYNKDNYQRSFAVMPSVYAEFSALESKLTFRTSYSQDISLRRDTKYRPAFYVSNEQKEDQSELAKRTYYNNNWIVDNILTYRDTFKEKHNYTVMLGNSIRRERQERMNIVSKNVPAGREEYWYHFLSSGIVNQKTGLNDRDDWWDDGYEDRGVSFFGRIMYDYQSKYIFSATLRADGSSKFQTKWGYFPSFGAGWNITSEDFMKEQKIFDALKLRGNWGRLGNDKVQRNPGFITAELREAYFDGKAYSGFSNLGLYRPTRWEKVEEMDFGIDATFLDNRLTAEFDYYRRKTLDLVYEQTRPATSSKVLINNADVLNSGFELTLNWSDKINDDFHYNVGLNMSTLKNEVTYLGGADREITPGDYSRVKQIGKPIDAFFGYEVEGIYQTQEEIDNDATISALIDKPKPGYLKYKDVDDNGVIDDRDRKILGSHIPTFYLGGNIGFSYKSFDFSTSFNGSFGHYLLNQKRFLRQKQTNINFDKNQINNAWSGQGSTNKDMSFEALGDTWNYSKFNSYFVEKADNFNIGNIQLGYTFNNILKGSANSKLRVNITAENPFSFFTYNGFTTEKPNGIDDQLYPFARTISFGVKFVY